MGHVVVRQQHVSLHHLYLNQSSRVMLLLYSFLYEKWHIVERATATLNSMTSFVPTATSNKIMTQMLLESS
jgi:hypothetical protein